ncbi:lipid A deacylase LpxR family protein [Fulvivirgaceae bacterium BMA12]|uniref:Lipid A deacylase LpxR family protein n=1 Tax=Agaribacillus aureus TaxID=3051825 RepID=A0ABT8KZT1_9BACT|nr:lipid A deacylase LpxR family protein [Fulvivirgaceae bacterium BMA12]
MVRLLIIFVLICFFSAPKIQGQETKANQIIVQADNDQFYFNPTDRYYSNGIGIRWERIIGNHGFPAIKGVDKRILVAGIQHKIYTPSAITFYENSRHDRPYAATLTVTGGLRLFFHQHQYIQSDITLGVAGPMALGQKLQEWWHDRIDIFEPRGWENQIVNNPVAAIRLQLTRQWFHQRFIDFISTSTLNLGTMLTSVRQSGKFRVGNPKTLNTSAYSGGHLGSESAATTVEIYFFAGGGMEYVNYNGLIEGNWIGRESPHTLGIVPWVFHGEYGLQVSAWFINTSFTVHHLSKEVKNGLKHRYASIKLGIKF